MVHVFAFVYFGKKTIFLPEPQFSFNITLEIRLRFSSSFFLTLISLFCLILYLMNKNDLGLWNSLRYYCFLSLKGIGLTPTINVVFFIVEKQNYFNEEIKLKFTQFCNFWRALGKISVFKNFSLGIWGWRFS